MLGTVLDAEEVIGDSELAAGEQILFVLIVLKGARVTPTRCHTGTSLTVVI
jgi:hypothetical protein